MNDDRYQKNKNNLPLMILLMILTLAVVIMGFTLAFRLAHHVLIQNAAYIEETDTENGMSEGQTEEDAALTEKSGSASGDDSIQTEQSTSAANHAEEQNSTLDVVAVVKKAMPSIVAITNKSVQEVTYMYRGTVEIESESCGSGIIIGKNDTELLIATNYHVLEGASTITVCFSVEVENEEDAVAEAVLKGSDESQDLAVAAVPLDDIAEAVLGQITIAELGSSETLVVGEPAIAIGNALGYGQSVTLGVVSALDRTIEVEGVTGVYIQTDAAINAGNSGGALLNASGEVIGINSAKVSSSGVEGMGYAIPIDEAKPVLETLMERETRIKAEEDEQGYLGVYVQDISEETRTLYEIPNGVYVVSVEEDSPAENAGIQTGDIISGLDGVTVSSVDGFEELLEYYRVGETVSIEILRSDKGTYSSQTLSVTFSEQPEQEEDSSPGFSGPFGSMRPAW